MNRSQNMSRIRSRDTSPELILRRALWAAGVRYRLGVRLGRIRPDLVITSSKTLVFVDGCFWHGCPLHYVRPRSNTDFWSRRLRENVERDIRQTRELEMLNWRVLRFWEHEVFVSLPSCVESVLALGGTAEACWRVVEAVPIDDDGTTERRELCELRGRGPNTFVVVGRTTTKW